MSWRERIRAAREEQKLTREQVINKMRLYIDGQNHDEGQHGDK